MRVSPIGSIRSVLKRRADAPRQGSEGASDAWLDVIPEVADGLQDITAGDEIILLTWLRKSQRNILKTHPRSDKKPAFKFRECVGDDLKTIRVKSFPGVVKPKHAKPWFSRGSCTSLAPIATS